MKIFVFALSMSCAFVLCAASAQDDVPFRPRVLPQQVEDVWQSAFITMNPLLFASEDALRLAESHGYARRQITGRNGRIITLELLAAMSGGVMRQLSSPVDPVSHRFAVRHFDQMPGNPHEEFELPL